MLYICQYCITMVIYMSQKGLRQAGGVFRCLSGLSCCLFFFLILNAIFIKAYCIVCSFFFVTRTLTDANASTAAEFLAAA